MDINNADVLKKINNLIASDRLNKLEILQLVKLSSISSNFKDLKDNMKWEKIKSKY